MTHLDFVQRRQKRSFSGTAGEEHAAIRQAMDNLPMIDLPNDFLRTTALQGRGRKPDCTSRTGVWAQRHSGISNGAVFADLDLHGDLDLVTNNINEEATILRNRVDERRAAHTLQIALHGPEGNTAEVGTKVMVTPAGEKQYHDHSPYRGYQSTVESVIHVGLGAGSVADAVQVVWPDGATQHFADVPARQVLDVHYASSARAPSEDDETPNGAAPEREPLFREAAANRGLVYRHEETEVDDFKRMLLLPHKYSQNGPGIASAISMETASMTFSSAQTEATKGCCSSKKLRVGFVSSRSPRISSTKTWAHCFSTRIAMGIKISMWSRVGTADQRSTRRIRIDCTRTMGLAACVGSQKRFPR